MDALSGLNEIGYSAGAFFMLHPCPHKKTGAGDRAGFRKIDLTAFAEPPINGRTLALL